MNAKLLILLFVLCLKTTQGDEHGFVHEKTAVRLPGEIAGLELSDVHKYDEPALGVSLAYKKGGVLGSIYFYDRGIENLEEKPDLSVAGKELSSALHELKQIEEMGIYAKVTFGENGQVRGKEGLFRMIWMPLSFEKVQDPQTREPIEPVPAHSLLGVGVYKGHFIKLRYSFVPEEGQAALEKQRDDFLAALVQLVTEAALRPEVKKMMEVYIQDPLSEEGKEALSGLVAYGEMSELVTVEIDSGVVPWMELENYPYGQELLGAFIVGNMQHQFITDTFQSNRKGGVKQVLEVYKLLLEKDPAARVEALDNWLADGGAPAE